MDGWLLACMPGKGSFWQGEAAATLHTPHLVGQLTRVAQHQRQHLRLVVSHLNLLQDGDHKHCGARRQEKQGAS